jgi:hypothetical protein
MQDYLIDQLAKLNSAVVQGIYLPGMAELSPM